MSMYYVHPIYLFYWVALKQKMPLKDWAAIIKDMGRENEHPYKVAISIIDEYGL